MIKKLNLFLLLSACSLTCFAETTDLSAEEAQVVAAILANADKKQEIKDTEDILPPAEEKEQEAQEENETDSSSPKKCLTVAFIDIDEAFNAHPRTVAVKEQIRLKILAKEEEVQGAKQLIAILHRENGLLSAQLREIKPFYERIVVEPHELLPKPKENADALLFGNLLNRLTFAGAEMVTTSPLDTPARLDDLTGRIAANKKIIEEREFFIDNYKYTTREEILRLEKKEVNEILKDIYTEIKSFAKKRNIGAIVRKDEILYGEKPVNVTNDFISRLKKSKKYRKRGN
jgi:Skp family chaperone for outer membrane proteins